MSCLFLGIDTSNYKTSLAVIDENGSIVFNKSEYLDVKQGERGLRQSDAFFKQSNNLPAFVKEAFSSINTSDIAGIGVSTRPRRLEGSYMPCFLAGYNLAQELGAAIDVPVYEFSHQEGHAAAVIDASCFDANERILFCHLSGGTTELLLCSKDDEGYNMQIIGGTKDISIGQLIDRIGVELGYAFPSGMYLDTIAESNIINSSIIPKIKLEQGYFNLSGIETKLIRYISEEHTAEELNSMVAELFSKIADLLHRSIEFIKETYDVETVYLAGGVASSESVRHLLSQYNYKFGRPELSGDNAVGIANLARMQHDIMR